MKQKKQALIVVDVQNDFLSSGALEIPGSDKILTKVNHLISHFDHVILTQDWHPKGHISFQSANQDKFENDQEILWPDHCIQGSYGADFAPNLFIEKAELILRKGFQKNLDSYSAFFENDKITSTGLHGFCKERGFEHLTFCGLATDFCVGFSALDALKLGFQVDIYLEACCAIDKDNSLHKMLKKLNDQGANLFLRF